MRHQTFRGEPISEAVSLPPLSPALLCPGSRILPPFPFHVLNTVHQTAPVFLRPWDFYPMLLSPPVKLATRSTLSHHAHQNKSQTRHHRTQGGVRSQDQ
jgi:hypothetical protein